MRKRLLLVAGLLVAVLLAVGLYVAVRLNRGGYLPKPVSVTADPAPTAVPLPKTPEAVSPTTVVPSKTPRPTETAAPTPLASPTMAPTVAPTGAPTRRVIPPEPIQVPDGFGVSVFAEGLSGPRMMAVGPEGDLYLAERDANRIIRLPDRDSDGVADVVEVVAAGLSSPSSLAFYVDGSLYVGEPSRVLRLSLGGTPLIADGMDVIVDGIPTGGHSTRTVLFDSDGAWLYVSVGSSCNVCEESDLRRATIVRYHPDGGDEAIYATGLRNAVGITFRPGTAELWATNNGRDWLGDDQPPETVYIVGEGDDAGWPRCHSGRIVDPDYGFAGACEGVVAPVIEMQAHTAPLGLGFYTGVAFPEAYHGDLFVALHGSWNRSVPVGYKVLRIPVEDGAPGPAVDFAAGWLRDDGSQWGRPVDVVTSVDGSLLVSDDGAGRVYRIYYRGQ
jgi:glucose/arabinose dehydrogenase